MRPTRRKEGMRLRPWRAFALVTLVVPVSIQAGGCGAADDVSAGRPADRPAKSDPIPILSGIYRTSLTFVTFGQDSSAVHLSFIQRTDARSLRRDYQGWILAGDGWKQMMDLHDVLPTPAAAWRVLPGGPLRVRIGGGAEISGLFVAADSGGGLNLIPGHEIAHWTGVTGQIESLRTATLRLGDAERPGLLLTRQAGAPVGSPLAAIRAEAALLATENGDGILLLRTGDNPEEAVTAWTWIGGVESEWTDAAFLPRAAPTDSAPHWSLTLPEAGIMGEVHASAVLGKPEPPATGAPPPADERDGDQLMRISGSLLIGGTWRPVIGAAVRGPALPGAAEKGVQRTEAATDSATP